jgi:hypothetical protein
MIRLENCEFAQLRSYDDEAVFFAQMGRFFASATVRRDCGGYPLNDGPRYRWFVVRNKGGKRVLGFISVEHQSQGIRIRNGYLRAEARKQGLFRELRRQVFDYIDGLGLDCTLNTPQTSVPFLLPHGFYIQTTRGAWVMLKRNAHATSRESSDAHRNPVR